MCDHNCKTKQDSQRSSLLLVTQSNWQSLISPRSRLSSGFPETFEGPAQPTGLVDPGVTVFPCPRHPLLCKAPVPLSHASGFGLGPSRENGAQQRRVAVAGSRTSCPLSGLLASSLKALAWHYLHGLGPPQERLSAQLTSSSNPPIPLTSLQNRV